jgi:long-chain acyl-CoA synthetase
MGIPLAWTGRAVTAPSSEAFVAIERAPGTGAEGQADGRVISAHTPSLVAPAISGSLADLPFRNAAEAPSAAVFARRAAGPEDGRGGGGGGRAGGGAGGGGEGGGGGGQWRDVTAAEFAAQVTDVAKGLIEAGVEPGGRVAIMSRTRYEWTLLDFAVWAAGGVVVPLYPTASAEQAAWTLRDSGVRAVVAEDETCARVVEDALSNYSGVLLSPPPVWRFDQGAIEELMMRGGEIPGEELARRRAALSPASMATIVYTSGTTGMPKAVPLSHGNFLAAAGNCIALLPVFRPAPDERTLLFLPLAHVLARAVQVACVQARVQIAHSPSMQPTRLREDLESFGATFLVGVPYVFEKIHQLGRAQARARHVEPLYGRATRVAVRYGAAVLRAQAGTGPGPSIALKAAHRLYDALIYSRVRKALGGRIREAVSGGSALSPELLMFFEGAGVRIYEGYGLTETTGPSTVNPAGHPKPGTVGPPLPGSSVRIAEDGEVLLRGPQVFPGYLPGKGASHEVLAADADTATATGTDAGTGTGTGTGAGGILGMLPFGLGNLLGGLLGNFGLSMPGII